MKRYSTQSSFRTTVS